MEHKRLNRVVAGGVFLSDLAKYVVTLSSTVAPWDVGESRAAAFFLRIPHLPGAPLFLLFTRFARLMVDDHQAIVLLSQLSGNSPATDSETTEPPERMEQVPPLHMIGMDFRTKMFVARLYSAGERAPLKAGRRR